MTEPGGKKVDMEFARFEDHLYNKYRFDGSTKTNAAARAKAQIKIYEYKSQIQKKIDQLKQEYESLHWKRKRISEYPDLEECIHVQ